MTDSQERSPTRHSMAIRLADEGVPIGVIARAMQRPYEDVLGWLVDARSRGRILDLPRSDWTPGKVGEGVAEPRPIAGDRAVGNYIAVFGISRCEAVLLDILARRDTGSNQALYKAVSEDADPSIVKVYMCKMRPKLARHGITINTLWGYGYELAPEMKARLRDVVAARTGEGAAP